jgi:hypothetical protein
MADGLAHEHCWGNTRHSEAVGQDAAAPRALRRRACAMTAAIDAFGVPVMKMLE